MLKKVLFVLSVPFLITSCTGQNTTGVTISVDTFDKLLSEDKSKIILDVRTPSEVKEGIIPEAIVIDYNNTNFDSEISKLDKSKTIYVYCAKGGRSSAAMNQLLVKGCKVYNLNGGFSAWKRSQKPISIP